MQQKSLKLSLAGLLCIALLAGAYFAPKAFADDEAKPKHTIKEVMKAAMGKGKLVAKVSSGEASDEEKKELLDMMISLVENKPPKGDMESWHNLAGAITLAAAKVAVGREDGIEALKAAANCKACHSVHKP